MADSANAINQLDTKPEYVRVAEPASPAMGGGGGYGPYFGSFPISGRNTAG